MSSAKISRDGDGIREILESYYVPLPPCIESKVQKYLDLLEHWGGKISLTSVASEEEMLRFHFGESIFALSLGKLNESRLADVGTGAGFPGMALKLAEPTIRLSLIEPNRKKCAFLHEVVRALTLEDVTVIPRPFESAGIAPGFLNTITCRALVVSKKMLVWAKWSLAPGGAVLLWLGAEDCLTVRRNSGWKWSDPVLIPGTKGRFVLKGSPADSD